MVGHGGIETQGGSVDATQPGSLHGDATLGGPSSSAGMHQELDWLQPGQEIEQFVVQRILGRGAMGIVVLAHDRELDRPVAIKLLANAQSEVAAARLLREAKSAARLSHPNVVAVHQVGTFRGQIYVVMEWVAGGNLRDWVAEQRPSWSQIVDAYVQAARGLMVAHAAGFVHRDFKPDNVLIGRNGRVRVTDFGLVAPASTVAGTSGPRTAAEHLSTFDRLTQSGAILGTPAYMAPEQFGLAEVDPRADQFSFCVSLFEALYGRRPFEGATAANLYLAIEQGRITQVPPGRVPPSIHAAIVRGLAFDPAHRWPSMEALVGALTARPAARSPGPLATAAAAVGALAVTGGGGLLAYTLLSNGDLELTTTANVGADTPCPEPSTLRWNDARRRDVASALGRSTRADIDALTTSVQTRLDAWAQAWSAAHVDACQAAEVRHEQPPEVLALRHACLEQAAVEMDAVVTLLATTEDAQILDAARGILDALPRIERCADVEALKAEASLGAAPPSDEHLRRTAEIAALMRAGREPRAAPLVEALVETLEADGHPRLLARAQVRRSEIAFTLGDLARATDLARQAVDAATRARAADLEASARNLLLNLVAYDPSAQTTADELIRQARDAAGRARDELTLARMHVASGVIYSTTQRLGEAETEYGRALGILEGYTDRAYGDRFNALAARAASWVQQGKLDAALEEYDRAIAVIREGLGDGHPLLASALMGKAAALASAANVTAARSAYAEARQVWERAYGADHPPLGLVDHHLAMIEQSLGNLDAAIEHYERAIAVKGKAPKGPDFAMLLDQYGMALYLKKRWDEADPHFVEAAEIYQAAYGEHDVRVAGVLFHRAAVAASAADFERALELFERVLAIQEGALGKLNVTLAYTLTEIGDVLLFAERCSDAMSRYQRAMLIRQSVGLQLDADATRILVGQAQCDLLQGDVEQARTKVRESTSAFGLAGLQPGIAARVHLVEAELAQHDEDPDGVRANIERARQTITDYGLEGWSIATHVEHWIARRLSDPASPRE